MTLSPGELALWMVPLAIVGYALWGNRPSVDRFAGSRHLVLDDSSRRAVRAGLVRTYRGRVAGAAAGALVAVGLIVVAGSRAPAVVAIGSVLVGTLLGVGLAQFRRTAPTDAIRTASLAIRDVDSYRPRRAALAVAATIAVTAAYGAAVIAFADHGGSRVAAAVAGVLLGDVVVAVVGRRLEHRVVEQTRPQAVDLAVDDALRATTVRALHRSVVGVLLCGIAFVGFAGVESQMFEGVQVGNRVEFRLPAGASFVEDEVSVEPTTVRVVWRDGNGDAQTAVLPSTEGASVTIGQLGGSFALVAIGAWVVTLGLLGALFQWSRASKAWRRPDRTTVPDAGDAPLGVSS